MRSRTEENSRDNVASLMSPTALRQCSQTWACSSLILLLLLYWSFAPASLYLTQKYCHVTVVISTYSYSGNPFFYRGEHSSWSTLHFLSLLQDGLKRRLDKLKQNIEEATAAVEQEREKNVSLLHLIFPPDIAKRLWLGKTCTVRHHALSSNRSLRPAEAWICGDPHHL